LSFHPSGVARGFLALAGFGLVTIRGGGGTVVASALLAAGANRYTAAPTGWTSACSWPPTALTGRVSVRRRGSGFPAQVPKPSPDAGG
jgi:hypothetical protein